MALGSCTPAAEQNNDARPSASARKLSIVVDDREVARASKSQLRGRIELSQIVSHKTPVTNWKRVHVTMPDGSQPVRLHDLSGYGKIYQLWLYWDDDKDLPAAGMFETNAAQTAGHQALGVAKVEISTVIDSVPPSTRELAITVSEKAVHWTADHLAKVLPMQLPPENPKVDKRKRQRARKGFLLSDVVRHLGHDPATIKRTIVVDHHGHELVMKGSLVSAKQTMMIRVRKNGAFAVVIWTAGVEEPEVAREVHSIRVE